MPAENYVGEMVAVPYYRKFGYSLELLLGIEADAPRTDEVAQALTKLNEVYRVSCTTGSFNIFACLAVRSMNDVARVLSEKIRNIPGIDHVVTFCRVETKRQWTATGP